MSSIVPSPPVAPDADATTRGVVNPTAADQTLGVGTAIHRFANLVVGAVATLAETVTNLVRATGVALVLRSDVGTGATDVSVKLGTSRNVGDTNQSAIIAWVGTGIGSTETPSFKFYKGGLLGGGAAYLRLNDSVGAQLDYGSSSVQMTSTFANVRGGAIGQLGSSAVTGPISRIGSFNAVSDSNARLSVFSGAIGGTAVDRACVTYAGEFESLVSGAGIVLKSPDGTRWRITVSNAGVLGVAAA